MGSKMEMCKTILEWLGHLIWQALKLLFSTLAIITWHVLKRFWSACLELKEPVKTTVCNQVNRFWTECKKISRGKRRNAKTTIYCPQMVDDFENFADSLSPSKQYLQEGQEVMKKIFETLKTRGSEKGLKIARTRLAGSLGKNTGISFKNRRSQLQSNPDFDLVVFINDIGNPPFPSILEKLKSLVESIDGIGTVHVSKISVQFSYHSATLGEIKFDLLPARNHVKHPSPFEDVGETEAKRTLGDVTNKHLEKFREREKLSTDDNKFYSSSFCEKTVALIRERVDHPFYLKVVRLAKYWNSQVDMNGIYIPARSYMVELIAIHNQRGKRKKCLISGFRRFLDSMTSFKTLRVQIGPPPTTEAKENEQDTEELFEIHNTLLVSTPLILDPANPYNNLAHGINQNAVKIWMTQARKTIKLLDGLKRSTDYECVENVIDAIFSHK